ncbi:hypothetical protein [uncultured Zhongshania sp.]|uniref:hypothetical protein n=1 Tax=uncultured Zhongshania sp. TaxID=1642288 RepID=UPI0025DB94A8|nr:hypothetical protein [uncultured Zhongshania sp.]
MATVFVIQNQHGHYLNKQLEWVDGRDKRVLYRTVHRDEAINVVFEQSSKNIELRAHPLECETDETANPKVEAGPAIMSQVDDLLADDEQIDENTPDHIDEAADDIIFAEDSDENRSQ